MFKFLAKYDGVAIQNKRIINQDFPWLWAVSNFWSPSTVKISVATRDLNDALEKLLMEPIGDRKRLELWARAERKKDGESELYQVKKVEFQPGVPLMRLLLALFPGGYFITDVVVIVPHPYESAPLSNAKNATHTVRIYRKRKEEQGFDLWLVELMRKYEQRVPF